MPANEAPWRDHYLELLREGEANGLSGSALGYWISQRLTPAELRGALASYYRATDARDPRKPTDGGQHA